ncbi:laccase-15 [Camponotus floridanus]|nr:laccase-15 [Camponotus floridanus]
MFTSGTSSSQKVVNDDARLGRPTSTIDDNVEAVKKIVMENRRITIREVAEDVGISVGSCYAIFSGVLGMQRVAAKFVSKLLNFDQKQRRVDIAQELLNAINDDPDLLKRVITGERIDFILNANQTLAQYWIHVRGLGECEEKRLYQLAILAYKDSSKSSLSSQPGYSFGVSKNIFNPPNSTECGNGLCVYELNKIYSADENIISLTRNPDYMLILSFDFFNYSTNNGERLLFNSKNQEYKPFFVAVTGSHLISLVNNISYQNPSAPLISQSDGYQFMCDDVSVPSTCTEPCFCTHVYHIPLHATVDVMIYDKRPLEDLNHPFHLHGYSFCVIYTGQFINALNKSDITNKDVMRELNAHMTRLRNDDYKNCAPKDTVIVPNTGFVILRFKADNPGWWFLHCHFLWHTATGMNVILHVGTPYDLPPVPRDFPKCCNWTPRN